METLIFHEEAVWERMEPILSFKKGYGSLDGICKYMIIAEATDNPYYSTTFVVVRAFLQHETQAKKYVMGTCFYDFGGFATLDIVSLDCASHKDIIARHAERLGWPSIGSSDVFHIPFAFVGGLIDPESGFVGSSGDYGDNFFGWSSNDVAKSAMAMINGESDAPDQFFLFMLNFMKQHKRQPDFYEKLYEELLGHLPAGASLHPQHLGSLVAMKVLDRVMADGTDVLQAWAEESSGGLGSFILLNNVAKKMKEAT